jgi:hypothetical protein
MLDGSRFSPRASGLNQEDTTALPSETPAIVQPATPSLDDCTEIAMKPDVLGYFAKELHRAGVVGEERLAKVLYLAITSRLLQRPVSVAVKGPSSGGKSYLVGKVLDFFPEDAYYELSAMSEKALCYSEEPLEHRFLVMYEAAGMKGEFAEYSIRSLLSEGRLRYLTVEKTAGGALTERLIEKQGPTGLIVTTTLASLHPENETRYLSVMVADTPEQTKHILRSMAAGPAVAAVDYESWQTFQRWLKARPTTVSIPFADALVDLIPPAAVRLRRDFGTLLALIQTHALVHQTSRERDVQLRLVAELEDYEAVYELVADLIAAGVEASVPTTVRETVEAVAKLTAEQAAHAKGVSGAAVAATLGLDKSVVSRRLRVAQERGYIENLEDRRGNRSSLILGDPLPQEQTVLPSPEKLAAYVAGCTVAVHSDESPAKEPEGCAEAS